MDELHWHTEPAADRPILVVAFRGLFDASGSATAAIEALERRFPNTELASIDPETFFDFTQERPAVYFDDTGRRRIRWPENVAYEMDIVDGPRNLVALAGVEPHLRWRTFAEALLEVARRSGAEMVVTLGSMVGMTPHTRPLGVVASAANPTLAQRLGVGSPSYQGPTGVVGTLHDILDTAGVPVISLRVSVPHYVPNNPNPKATRALLRRFEQVTGVETGHAELDDAAAAWQAQVDEAVAGDDDIAHYVTRLEEQADHNEELLPSGDDLAAELEAFLREQESGE